VIGAEPGERLGREFFAREPNIVARELLGCTLRHGPVGGRIVETEAYAEDDPACHAYVGRTDRTAVIFGPPGHAYVYLSYGIHQLFNVVTEPDGLAAAVLIRALEPSDGLEHMRRRRPGRRDRELCAGPGRLTEALGIGAEHNRADLVAGPIALHRGNGRRQAAAIVSGPRIGISKGVELPWRYCEAGSRWLSAPAGHGSG
jgi:DNA-3-methyladenine glycosylase